MSAVNAIVAACGVIKNRNFTSSIFESMIGAAKNSSSVNDYSFTDDKISADDTTKRVDRLTPHESVG